MRDLIMSPARPIGEVIDFFYRVEFSYVALRTFTCLFWVKDAPEFEKDQDQMFVIFIDKYISCKLPDPNKDPELHRIVSEVQMHSRNHSKSCRKNKKHCRFGFPKPPITEHDNPPQTSSCRTIWWWECIRGKRLCQCCKRTATEGVGIYWMTQTEFWNHYTAT